MLLKQFPSEPPKREKSAGADDLKYPVMSGAGSGVEKSHSFKDTAPAAYKVYMRRYQSFLCRKEKIA